MNKLQIELKKYIENTTMSEEEITAVREWVADGNSVYTNPSMAVDEHGNPVDFLCDYRYHAEINKELSQLTGKEREMYLARLRGEDTIDTLREDLYKAIHKCDVYYYVLRMYGLLAEAELLLNKEPEHYQLYTEELPFQ